MIWVCEQHPWRLWPAGDKDCSGPGMLLADLETRINKIRQVLVEAKDCITDLLFACDNSAGWEDMPGIAGNYGYEGLANRIDTALFPSTEEML